MTASIPHPDSGRADAPHSAQPLITVVTICRNAEQTIEATLQSVASQQQVAGRVEHIVVDGASDDHTLNIVREFAAVTWVSEPDRGISDAFNKGMRLANGKYILYLNADDYLIDETVLADVAAFIEANQSPDWIVGDVVAARDGAHTYEPRRYPPSCWSLMFRNRIGHPSVFLKREILLKVGGFDERFKTSMDYDLYERLCARGIRPTYFPRLITVFSMHGVSSLWSPAHAEESHGVTMRFRDTSLKRLVGHAYDRLRGFN